jgi:hypothetical protein
MKGFLQLLVILGFAVFFMDIMIDMQHSNAVRDWFGSSVWHWLPISIIIFYLVNKMTEK